MSLLTALETDIGDAINTIESDTRALAALVWNDFKSAAAAGEQLVVSDAKKLLPDFVAKLKAYALEVVQSLEKNPAFVGAVGSWKFGTACQMLWSAAKTGLLGPAITLGQATVETLIQGAIPALLAAL